MIPLQICQQCEFRKRPCRGSCPCLGDDKGEDIIAKAERGECPKGYFARVSVAAGASLAEPPVSISVSEGKSGGCGGCRRAREGVSSPPTE